MIFTNIAAATARTISSAAAPAAFPGLMKQCYPIAGRTGGREERGIAGGLLGDLEGGLLLAPPDFPLVGRGPLLLGDVLVGLDHRLLDVLEPRLAGVLVALLALVVAVRAGLLVL